MNELVSVLVPAYNAEHWIRQSLQSALDQTWRPIEVIVVDDGSTDRTLETAKSVRSPLVKIVSQANAGSCAARNAALELAQGSYIQWLDADDLLHRDKIARQLARADDGHDSRTLLTAAWGKFFYRPEKAKFERDPLWQDLLPVDWLVTKFSANAWMNPAVWLVSRRLTELAGPWDPRVAASGDDDGEYVCRLAAASDFVRFVPDARCYYRIGNAGSLNWDKEQARKSLDPLVLSIGLSIEHLLALEDSEKTRAAALRYLQTFSQYFYSRDEQEFEPMRALARKLGATLVPPRASWKYYPLERVFGPRATKRLMSNWRAAKMMTRRNLDRSLYRLAR
jgi:glycosyltransferase involved in cell wall biosynthesis